MLFSKCEDGWNVDDGMDGAEDHCDASESCMLVSMMLDSADSHGEEID